MQKNRLLSPVLTILIALSLILSACGTATTPVSEVEEPVVEVEEPVVEEPVVEPVTIKVMTFFAVDTPEVEQGIVDAFEAAYPNIKIDFELLPFSDYFTKLKTVIAGGAAPDVVAMNYENLQQFAALGALAELDSFIEAENFDLDQYYANTVAMHSYKGTHYGLPATFSTVPLFINTTLFDEAGIDYPDENWDWDDLIEAGKALTIDKDEDGVIDQFGYATAWWPMYLFLNDASFFNEDETQCTLNSPEAVEGLQKMVDLKLVEGIAPTQADLSTQSDWDMFIAGRLAMFPVGPWGIGPFQNDIKNYEWDVAHHPAMAQQATFLFGNAYGIPAASANKEAAWEFIKFATGPAGGQLRQEGGYEISSVQAVAESQFLSSLAGKPPEHAEIFMTATDYAYLTPAHPRWNEMHDAIWPELELALLGEQSVQEAMDKACPLVNAILAE
jgi:multiple sugar transport system substrate-binding protein